MAKNKDANEKIEIIGVCEWFCETGLDPVWAIKDNKYITRDQTGREQCFYKELHVLEQGDYLTIYHPCDPDEILWEGFISETEPLISIPGSANALNHPKNLGISLKKWNKFFFRNYPAILIPKSHPKQ